jgi:hypothetical protein
LHACTWWYDPRHDDAIDSDRATLTMSRRNLSGSPNTTVISSNGGSDNKLRISETDPFAGVLQSIELTLTFNGAQVTLDDSGCGTNAVKVYYAWMYEDGSGALSDARPEDTPDDWSIIPHRL